MTYCSYPDALAAVKAKVAASRTSFQTGMSVLPKARRNSMYAVYAFCRAVDDIADDSPSPEIAGRELQLWRHRIADLFKGIATDEITTALLPAIGTYGLVEKDFQDIIDGMEMDSVAIVAPDAKTLDLYCDRVASAVGRISVRVFGDCSPDALMCAYHLGRAFQLTNILRDLAEDSDRGRLYLPRELLDKHGIALKDPKAVLQHAKLANVCHELAAQATTHYTSADAAIKKCPRSATLPSRIMRMCYGAILEKLIASDWRDPYVRVKLSKAQKIGFALKGMFL